MKEEEDKRASSQIGSSAHKKTGNQEFDCLQHRALFRLFCSGGACISRRATLLLI